MWPIRGRMRNLTSRFTGALIICATQVILSAQSTPQPALTATTPESRLALEQKLGEIASALTQTREQLERSQRQMELLQSQLLAIQNQLHPAQPVVSTNTVVSSSSLEPSPSPEESTE